MPFGRRTREGNSEQFPTALRGRGHIFSESTVRLFAGVLAPYAMEPHTGSAPIFFGTDPDVASEFARDSPLEQRGFELMVPHVGEERCRKDKLPSRARR
jgi:hypothetical protein